MPLVVTRNVTETIKIGDEITITIKKVSGSWVTLEIDAPKEVRILRGELSSTPEKLEGRVVGEKLANW